MRKLYKKKIRTRKNSTSLGNALPLCGSDGDSRVLGVSGIARIALSGEDAPAAGAPHATTPRAIRAIPENRRRFRTTLSVASFEREKRPSSVLIKANHKVAISQTCGTTRPPPVVAGWREWLHPNAPARPQRTGERQRVPCHRWTHSPASHRSRALRSGRRP